MSGELDTREQTLRRVADDWGHLVHRRPRGVLRPTSVDEVRAAVRRADGPLVPRGSGHSPAGESQTRGTVLDMTGLDGVLDVADGRLRAEAGARWSSVLRAALATGQTPPVLTDYLELTVGGTLAVGGIGGTTQHHGFQTDTVDELEVVTPDGQLRTCSRTRDPELFDRVRAGGGASGVVVRAVLRLVPAPAAVRRHLVRYRDLEALTADQRRFVAEGRFDHLQGRIDDGCVLDAAVFHDGQPPEPRLPSSAAGRATKDWAVRGWTVEEWDYAEFLDLMARQIPFLRSAESGCAWYRPHPWLNLLLPADTAVELVRSSAAELAPELLGETGLVLLYPFRTDAVTTPRIPLPPGRLVFLLAVLRTADTDTALAGMLAANHTLRERAHTFGGRIYLGAVTSTSD